jgi:hypothetical protein
MEDIRHQELRRQEESTSGQKCEDGDYETMKHSKITFCRIFKEDLQKYAHLIEKECLNPEYLDSVGVDELREVGFSETVLNKLFQSKTADCRSSSQRMAPHCGQTLSVKSHLYGELVTLGYRSYQLSSNQDLIPVGTANDIFRLQFKPFLEDECFETSATVIIKPNLVMANKNYYPAIGACEVPASRHDST